MKNSLLSYYYKQLLKRSHLFYICIIQILEFNVLVISHPLPFLYTDPLHPTWDVNDSQDTVLRIIGARQTHRDVASCILNGQFYESLATVVISSLTLETTYGERRALTTLISTRGTREGRDGMRASPLSVPKRILNASTGPWISYGLRQRRVEDVIDFEIRPRRSLVKGLSRKIARMD